MDAIRSLKRFLALPLAAAVAWMTLGIGTAQAGLVPTEQVVSEGAVSADRARVEAFLARSDVQNQLKELGVAPAEALERVGSLSDAEVQRIADRLAERPAGADAGSSIIGAAVFIFVVLLITDILGLTNVFDFT